MKLGPFKLALFGLCVSLPQILQQPQILFSQTEQDRLY